MRLVGSLVNPSGSTSLLPDVAARLASESRWRGMAFGSARAFCAEIAELRRSPRFSCFAVGDGTLFFAPEARKILGDPTISACSAQKAVATAPPTFAMNPHADSQRHRTVGTGTRSRRKGLICNKIERGHTRDAVWGHVVVCDPNRASPLMAGRVALPICWADLLVSPTESA
jgi:hypothetical protein